VPENGATAMTTLACRAEGRGGRAALRGAAVAVPAGRHGLGGAVLVEVHVEGGPGRAGHCPDLGRSSLRSDLSQGTNT
jgi:hypothetical protein